MPESGIPSGGGPRDPEWFQRVADKSGLLFFILRVQPDIAFEFISRASNTEFVGHRPEHDSVSEAEGFLGRIDPDYADGLATLLTLPPGRDAQVELKWNHLDGRSTYSQGWIQSRERPDGSVALEGGLHDITQLRTAEAELRRSEERSRLLAENAWDVIWTMAPDGRITYVSPAVERLMGFTPEEAMSQSLKGIHPPGSAGKLKNYRRQMAVALANGIEPPRYREEQEYYRKDGSVVTCELQIIPHLDTGGRIVQLIGVLRDIGERKLLEAELKRIAATDPLTGVCNRRYGDELLTAGLARARGQSQSLSLLMLDIDHFKTINDTYGHQAGDRVLVEVGRRLMAALHGTDMVARWGGEEFVVLLHHCALPNALGLAEEIRARISDMPFDDVGTVTVSIGVAELGPDDDLDAWLARADVALYAAKRSGRNAVSAGQLVQPGHPAVGIGEGAALNSGEGVTQRHGDLAG